MRAAQGRGGLGDRGSTEGALLPMGAPRWWDRRPQRDREFPRHSRECSRPPPRKLRARAQRKGSLCFALSLCVGVGRAGSCHAAMPCPCPPWGTLLGAAMLPFNCSPCSHEGGDGTWAPSLPPVEWLRSPRGLGTACGGVCTEGAATPCSGKCGVLVGAQGCCLRALCQDPARDVPWHRADCQSLRSPLNHRGCPQPLSRKLLAERGQGRQHPECGAWAVGAKVFLSPGKRCRLRGLEPAQLLALPPSPTAARSAPLQLLLLAAGRSSRSGRSAESRGGQGIASRQPCRHLALLPTAPSAVSSLSPATSAFLGFRLLLSSTVVAAVLQLVCWHLHVRSPPAPSRSPPVPGKSCAPQTLRAKGNDKSNYRISQLNRVINLKGRRCWQLQHRCSSVDSGGALELLGGQHRTCSSALPLPGPAVPSPRRASFGSAGLCPCAAQGRDALLPLLGVGGNAHIPELPPPCPAPASGALCPWCRSQRLQQGRLYPGSSLFPPCSLPGAGSTGSEPFPAEHPPATLPSCSHPPCPNPGTEPPFSGQSPAQKPPSELRPPRGPGPCLPAPQLMALHGESLEGAGWWTQADGHAPVPAVPQGCPRCKAASVPQAAWHWCQHRLLLLHKHPRWGGDRRQTQTVTDLL